MTDGVVVVALVHQIGNRVDSARCQGAVELHRDFTLVGGEVNGNGAFGGNIVAIGNGGVVGSFAAFVVLTLHGWLQCGFALASQCDFCLLFGSSAVFFSFFGNDVFVAALGCEVGNASTDNQDGQYRGNNYAKRACLFFTVASFNFTLEMIQGFFAALFITTSHRVVLIVFEQVQLTQPHNENNQRCAAQTSREVICVKIYALILA